MWRIRPVLCAYCRAFPEVTSTPWPPGPPYSTSRSSLAAYIPRTPTFIIIIIISGQNLHQQYQRLARQNSEGVQLGQRAAIYARVSTSDQSCERQIAELTAFAERGGYDVVGMFKETASGASANRAARNQILDLVRIPTHSATHSDHIRPPVPKYSAICDAMP